MLGYGRQYMEEKYDQIVEFSGLEDFMDVPIKNYSSGMKSKLGFAIATIAEPEILILDEVLSVGDGKFRKKSEKKILDMMQDGTAVLFVSHSLAQVKRICNKAMILEGGKMIAFGDVDEVAQVYAEMTGELDELTVGQKNLVKKKNKKRIQKKSNRKIKGRLWKNHEYSDCFCWWKRSQNGSRCPETVFGNKWETDYCSYTSTFSVP